MKALEQSGCATGARIIVEKLFGHDLVSAKALNVALHSVFPEQSVGQPPSATEQKRSDDDLDKLKHETPDEQAARIRKDQEDRALLQDVLEAFDFRLVGEETVGSRPAYVLQATPHPGYHAHGKYAKMFSRVEGKLWVDKQDFGWIKVDGHVTESFSMELILARVERGSHITMEQTCVGEAVWVPKRIEIRATARILFLKSLDIQRTLTYTDYRPASDGPIQRVDSRRIVFSADWKAVKTRGSLVSVTLHLTSHQAGCPLGEFLGDGQNF